VVQQGLDKRNRLKLEGKQGFGRGAGSTSEADQSEINSLELHQKGVLNLYLVADGNVPLLKDRKHEVEKQHSLVEPT
jgi:hypothetical protein